MATTGHRHSHPGGVLEALGSKMRPRWSQVAQDSPKLVRKGFQDAPKWIKIAQDRPKVAQNKPKMPSKWPKIASNSIRYIHFCFKIGPSMKVIMQTVVHDKTAKKPPKVPFQKRSTF